MTLSVYVVFFLKDLHLIHLILFTAQMPGASAELLAVGRAATRPTKTAFLRSLTEGRVSLFLSFFFVSFLLLLSPGLQQITRHAVNRPCGRLLQS